MCLCVCVRACEYAWRKKDGGERVVKSPVVIMPADAGVCIYTIGHVSRPLWRVIQGCILNPSLVPGHVYVPLL